MHRTVSLTAHLRRGHPHIDYRTNDRLIYDVHITQLLAGSKFYLDINSSIYRLRTVYIVEDEVSKK